MVVFKEGDAIYHSKILSFYRKEPFELEACYQYPNIIPYLNPVIGECQYTSSIYMNCSSCVLSVLIRIMQ